MEEDQVPVGTESSPWSESDDNFGNVNVGAQNSGFDDWVKKTDAEVRAYIFGESSVAGITATLTSFIKTLLKNADSYTSFQNEMYGRIKSYRLSFGDPVGASLDMSLLPLGKPDVNAGITSFIIGELRVTNVEIVTAKFSIQHALDWLNSNAHVSYEDAEGKCGAYLRRAVEEGFGLQENALQDYFPTPAREFGPYLILLGFHAETVSPKDYKPGDIIVIQGYAGGTSDPNGIPYGHIEMYDGKFYISDFKQYGRFYPGQGYRDHKPTFKIYRYGN